MLPNYNEPAGRVPSSITVWYAGTDTLQEGYALCWDVAATVADTEPKERLGNQVVKPATANLMAFAGLVTKSCAGRTGPCFVDIAIPHRNAFVKAYCKINATAFTTLLGPVDAQYALGAFADATVNLAFVGVAAETADTSTTAAVKEVICK